MVVVHVAKEVKITLVLAVREELNNHPNRNLTPRLNVRGDANIKQTDPFKKPTR